MGKKERRAGWKKGRERKSECRKKEPIFYTDYRAHIPGRHAGPGYQIARKRKRKWDVQNEKMSKRKGEREKRRLEQASK